MSSKADLPKEARITKEYRRLKKVLKTLDKNLLATVEPLIRNAAFMTVSLDELQDIINAEGYIDEYQNGANQSGQKQSTAVKTHIQMTRNHAAVMKQLADLTPPVPKKSDWLQELIDE